MGNGMKILYFDCYYGINEEVILKSLMDLGIEENYIRGKFASIKPVKYEDDQNIFLQAADIVNNSGLSDNVKLISNKMINKIHIALKRFEKLSLYKNSVILSERNLYSIIAVAICLDYIKPEKILSSSIEIGRSVKSEEQEVEQKPNPLIFELLRDIPLKSDFIRFESTSIIGAAIISCIAETFTDDRNFIVRSTGYGAINDGVLSVYLADQDDFKFSSKQNQDAERGCVYDEQFILECNIDDMNPEIYGVVMNKLLKAGAADVYFTPIIMKKGRPAIKVSVLCSEGKIRNIEDALFTETSTFGVRRYQVVKTMLQRSFSKVQTKYGDVTVKKGFYKGAEIKAKPEHDDCRKIAEELGIPVIEVYKEVWKRM
jgi:pyridinium-3,5-bisthiocarboxylic acid mononucleotide nickel chelatase